MTETTIRPNPGAQTRFLSSTADIALYGGAKGGGKMLSLDTPVPTPAGWATVGSLRVGDELFTERGQVCRIVQVHAIEQEPASYRLTFDDGQQIEACEDHLWVTMTYADMRALTRRSDEYRRRRRRESRASKVGGKKTAKFTAAITERNRRCAKPLPPPAGAIRTTRQIAETLKTKAGWSNHFIPVAEPLELPDASLPLDPYLLGLWLGDGWSTGGGFSTADPEIVAAFAAYNPRQSRTRKYDYSITKFRPIISRMGLRQNKHLPAIYLRASKEQRLALLQGLMDTDGYCRENGGLEFTSTNKQLADKVAELVRSLGSKCRICTGRATLYGKDCGPKYRVNFSSPLLMFRLPRKLARQNATNLTASRFRAIVSCELITPRPMRCLTVSNSTGLFLVGDGMVPTHNTRALLMEALRHIKRPRYGAVIFRRTYSDIFAQGGLWDASMQFYQLAGGRPRYGDSEWVFPSGAKVQFRHLAEEADKYKWSGADLPLIGFDELTTITESQFWYLFSCSRTTCGIRPYLRGTLNPDADSWVASLVDWWIDQDSGYPIQERSGAVRYFIRVDDSLRWSSSWGDLHEEFPDMVAPPGKMPDGVTEKRIRPTSFTFVPAKLDDNPELERKDPEYRAKLMGMPLVERERFLGGNWKIRPAAGLKFPRDKWRQYSAPPNDLRLVRFWDKAATSEEASKGKGARTAGILMGELPEQRASNAGLPRFWIVHGEVGRWADAEREAKIKSLASLDQQVYGHVTVGMEREGGSGGKHSAFVTVTNLAGFDVYSEPATTNKPARWTPLATQQQVGNVAIVCDNTWDWAGFIRELDALAGDEALDKGKLKDQADAAAGAFKYLAPGGSRNIHGALLTSGDEEFLEQETGKFQPEELEAMDPGLRELIEETDSRGDRDARWDKDW